MVQLKDSYNQKVYKDIVNRFLIGLVISFAISLFIWFVLWNHDRNLVHTILELTSVCIGIATFLIIWSKGEHESSINDILGFGFLIVSIFDFIHMYYYNGLITNNIIKGELSMRFWVLARLAKVIVLFIFSCSPYMKKTNRYLRSIESVIITGVFIFILFLCPIIIPDLYNNQGVTTAKIALECVVIFIAILSLFQIKRNLSSEKPIKFKYIYVTILLIIPSEICFTFFEDSGSFSMVFGLVLKTISYYYLYKGVFQSLISYPYERLNENNKRLSDILNAIPVPIQTYNNENRIDFINNKFEELFKCPYEKVIGLNDREFLKVIHKVGMESENTLLERLNNNEEDTKNVIRTYLDLNGKQIKVLFNGFKINGGALFIANDVRQEQEIKNLNLQAQMILDAVNVPTMVNDYNRNIIACNKQFADLVEIEHKEIMGMNIDRLDYVLKIENRVHLNNIDFKDEVFDVFIETPKGNKKHIEITASVIKNIYNENIGRISVVQDLTKAKEEQSKLINQEKLALLGQMGATIVHETRNFLTTIAGNSQLIELYAGDEKLKNYARKINVATGEVNRIISDFLCLSKPRQTELEEVAFNDLVSSMKSTIETSSLMNKVELNLELNYDERYIYCDETQIRQVILNICKNAVEAMEAILHPVLRIETGLNEYSKEVFIRISDNGKGIDNETINKIGTPFFTTKKTGTGLGLNACYQIIREHNGRIDIESVLGEGTTFTIVIPYIEEELEDIMIANEWMEQQPQVINHENLKVV